MRTTATLLFALLAATGRANGPQNLKDPEQIHQPVIVFDHSTELLHKRPPYPPETIGFSTDPVAGMPFGQCLTLDIKNPGSSPYALNLQFFETNRWEVGDTGLIAFHCRTLETRSRHGASSLMIQYKPNYDDWRGHVQTDLFLTREWKQVLIPFEIKIAATDTPQTVLNLFLGGVDPHTFQIAGLRVHGFGKTVPLAKLPRSQIHYPGMEPDAPWRTAARQRIEQHRKANLQLKLVDPTGQPVEGATIHAKLERHQFGFGAAVHTPMLVSPNVPQEEREKYSAILTRTCSKITPTNAMKWRLHNHFKQHVPGLVAWCETHNMTLRGHLFIWPGFERLPDGYDLHKTNPAAFRKDLTDHIETFANLYPDAFSEWDVMNEPYTEHDYMDLLGKEIVLEWFETARKANPNYLTYINDYGILSDNNQEHRDNYYGWIEYLIQNNAPLDGIGFQGHFTTPMPPELILERIDRYAAFGKKMQITEFDFDHPDPDLQARFFEDFVTLIYSHPQMSALINWIFLEDNFRPSAALYRKDFTPTAMGQVWERLLTKEWHTEERRKTNPEGIVELRGFKGSYSITIEHNNQTRTHHIKLDADKTMQLIAN